MTVRSCCQGMKLSCRYVNPFALRKAKIVHNFGLSECNRVEMIGHTSRGINSFLPPCSTGVNSEGMDLHLLEEILIKIRLFSERKEATPKRIYSCRLIFS